MLVIAYSDGAPGCGLVAGEDWARVINSVSIVTGGVVLVLVEAESGVSA